MVAPLHLEFGRPVRVSDVQRFPDDGRHYELLDGALLVTPSPYTVDELQELPDDGHRYEIFDGMLWVTPAPNAHHQGGLVQLVLALSKALPDDLLLLVAPFEFRPDPDTEVQPDLLVVRKDELTLRRLVGHPPVLVIEILSRSTRRIDLTNKKGVYARAGVRHYWVLDPERRSLHTSLLVDGEYSDVAEVCGDETLSTDDPYPITVTPSQLIPDIG